MKKNYTRLCALALASCMSMASWAIDIVDGVYQLSTPEDMIEFAEAVQVVDNGTVNAVLLNDIDMTAYPEYTFGSSSISYKGVFDGQFHTITVALESNNEYHSLCRKLGGGTIKNLNVAGTMHAIGKHSAVLVGQSAGTGTIENVVTSVDITTTTMGDGSHGGLIGSVTSSSKPIISNVVVGGSMKGTSTVQCGGVIGWSDGAATLNNVLVIAEFEIGSSTDGTWGNLTFVRNPGKATLNNCYYVTQLDKVDANAKHLEAETLESGAACFALNSASETPVFFQNLGEDAIPVPDASHKQVFRNGRSHCDGSAYDEVVYSNTEGATQQDEHDFENGVCTYCHTVDVNYITLSEDGFYELATPEQLCWFAYMVKAGHKDINGRLTAPMDLSDVTYYPIGDGANPYAGTFEGNLHPITNANMMIFGTVEGATIDGIHVEGGVVSGSDASTQTGSICGLFQGTMTRCFSNASVENGKGDCGGLVGKARPNSVIKNCMFAGNLTCGWSAGLVAGSTDGNDTEVIISDILLDTRNVTYANGDGHGILVGWFHDGVGKYTSNIWVVEGGDLTDLVGYKHELDAVTAVTTIITEDELKSGMAAFGLNHGDIVNPTWFQALGEDDAPVLDPAHGIVFKISDDFYTNDHSEFVSGILTESRTYLAEVVAYVGDKDAFEKALEDMEASEEFDQALYQALVDARATLDASAAAYTKYNARVEEIITELDTDMAGAAYEAILDYVQESYEPNDTYPNGTSLYILENQQLTAEQIEEEIVFMNALMEAAVKANYMAGADITNLLVNADLSQKPNFTGWETTKKGSTLTTGTVEGVMTTAEVWDATADVHQTLTGLKNGVYEICANAATRPASNIFNANDNYIAYLYANNDEVYVQALTEDMVNDETAIDGINCHLTGDAVDHQMEIDGVMYYVPYGPVSAAYAFNGGRYVNRVLTNVTDGTLTIGIRIPGTGLAHDWMGFGNFKLTYLGTVAEAAGAMEAGVSNYVARANTLIDYTGVSDMPGEDEVIPSYKSMPEFSSALRNDLKENIAAAEAATSTEELLAVTTRFTEIFHQIESCKAAYIEYLTTALAMMDAVYADDNSTEDEIAEMSDAVDNVTFGWESGAFTEEEAKEMALIKNTAFYQRYFEGAPAYKNGFYQLASVQDLIWFSDNVNNLGNSTLCAEIVAPLDLEDSEFHPIGTANTPYAGTFKGNLYPITNLSCMFFGTAQNATIDGVNIQGGVVEGNATYSAHTGSLVGFLKSGTISRCYTSATVQNGTGDCGGFFGKIDQPIVIENCMFAGNILSGWSAGGIAGSTDGNDENVVIRDIMIDGRNITYGNGDGHGMFVGWYHDGDAARAENIWVIASPSLTDLLGYKHEDAVLKTKTTFMTEEEAATGMAAYGLNHGETVNPVWFQTIGTDEVPTLSSESKVVILVDGVYKNASENDEDAIEALKAESHIVNVYDLSGRLVLKNADSKTGLRSLPNGLYIIGGRKVMK